MQQAEGQAHDLFVGLVCEVVGGGWGRPQKAVTAPSVGNFLPEEKI